jgi:uncharacterized peroxidase-related enzyme
MSRISTIDPDTATGAVRAQLDGVRKGLGALPNMFRTAARSPVVLEALVAQFGAVGKGTLGTAAREAIALAVSELDACDYCLSAHALLGQRAGLSAAAIASARDARADDARLAAILQLARAIVVTRGRVGDAELAAARRAGIDDADLLEIVANVALTTFTNYLNLVADTDIDFPVVRHAER